MKWPKCITLIRHGQSRYNVLREIKAKDPDYQKFRKLFEEDYQSAEVIRLATLLRQRYPPISDYGTPLTEKGELQALRTGEALARARSLPDVIFYSPYMRTVQTLEGIRKGWEALRNVPAVADNRIREQEHGLALLFNDWRLFQVFHPEQNLLRDLQGPYWYQFPQGESVSQVRDRIGLMMTMLIREWAGKEVWLVTHHMTLLSIRANLERLTPEQFISLDEKEKPINCGVTRYMCVPNLGKDGKLTIVSYNERLF